MNVKWEEKLMKPLRFLIYDAVGKLPLPKYPLHATQQDKAWLQLQDIKTGEFIIHRILQPLRLWPSEEELLRIARDSIIKEGVK